MKSVRPGGHPALQGPYFGIQFPQQQRQALAIDPRQGGHAVGPQCQTRQVTTTVRLDAVSGANQMTGSFQAFDQCVRPVLDGYQRRRIPGPYPRRRQPQQREADEETALPSSP